MTKKEFHFDSPLKDKALKITATLQRAGFVAFFVGGCVRDFLLGKLIEDIDIATSASPEQIRGLFLRTVAVGAKFGVILVLDGEDSFEVATFRKDGLYIDGRHPESVQFSSPEEDAFRRDFTVNGLFWDPENNKIIDYVGGEEDLRKGVIRAIGDPKARFEEDKLRMLRAVRFSARFQFPIEIRTAEAISNLKHAIHEVSAERIRDELVKMLTDISPAQSIRLLDQTGLLQEILPEIARMKGVEQPPEYHPEGDVYVHTLLLLEKLRYPHKVLALGALFHDVGKPPTQTFEDRIRFNAHEHVGARMTETIMRRLKFSNKDIEEVVQCVKNHMVFGQVQKMRVGKLKNMMARDTFLTELELHRIDCASSHGILDNYHFLIEKQKEFKQEEMKPKPLLTGQDLIGQGMTPNPEFKEILEEAYLLQLEGKFSTKEEICKWLKENRLKR